VRVGGGRHARTHPRTHEHTNTRAREHAHATRERTPHPGLSVEGLRLGVAVVDSAAESRGYPVGLEPRLRLGGAGAHATCRRRRRHGGAVPRST
jgi:hypothetical protein